MDYPISSRCILRDFYVDDLFIGADILIEAKCIRDEIVKILKRRQFELNKWSSNYPELLQCNANAINEKSLNKESGSFGNHLGLF